MKNHSINFVNQLIVFIILYLLKLVDQSIMK